MLTIGLIGGMSWKSTVTYYQLINRYIEEKLGGLHSAKCLLYSVDFSEIEACQTAGDWEKSAKILGYAAETLEKAGAEGVVICTNTMHRVADDVQRRIRVPLLHIADATAHVLREKHMRRVGLLGTRYTMEQDFYKQRLADAGLTVDIPRDSDRAFVNRVIFEELCRGDLLPASKERFLQIIEELAAQGSQGVVLGCTEIGLLVEQTDTAVPLFDTTQIHAECAAKFMLSAR